MYMNIDLFKYLLCLILFKCVNSANILYLVALPSPSHHIYNREIINALASRGHNVTVLAPDFDLIPSKNVHYLSVNDIYRSDKMINYKEIIFGTNEITNQYTVSIASLHGLTVTCKGIHYYS